MISNVANPFCLALTGGIACGKSVVAGMLGDLGLDRVDADQIARHVVAPGSPGLTQVERRFGPTAVAADGSMDRRAIGEMVFASLEARRDLEAILHPLIWVHLADAMERARALAKETVFEIPLLFEKGNEARFSYIWVVAVSREAQLSRLMTRDLLTREQAEARLLSQMPLAEKIERADHVILNEGPLDELAGKVAEGLALWRLSRTSQGVSQ